MEKDDLSMILAYYKAKHNMSGILLSKEKVIALARQKENEFEKNVSRFRYSMNLSGQHLEPNSDDFEAICRELKDLTFTQLKSRLNGMILLANNEQ